MVGDLSDFVIEEMRELEEKLEIPKYQYINGTNLDTRTGKTYWPAPYESGTK